ncbi:hypothetical protein [Solicola gregarius]|uniref:Transmembrane protein n=1 Tax=Solicola gregarius TaxID=2908642 RepID=A0AA46YL35_9ACTN|nr:hypothetical protein [Solicola gregarius]UYM06147.1 hypothetical protein L0C25_03480 [Solicola gregarius]
MFIVGMRLLAALAVVVFGVLAINRSSADVTFTFPAADTAGLTHDVEFRCGTAPTSFEVSGGGVQLDGDEAYNDWALAIAKETAQAPDTSEVEIAACEAARDDRIVTLVWLVAGALAAGMVLLAFAFVPTRGGRRRDHQELTDGR